MFSISGLWVDTLQSHKAVFFELKLFPRYNFINSLHTPMKQNADLPFFFQMAEWRCYKGKKTLSIPWGNN